MSQYADLEAFAVLYSFFSSKWHKTKGLKKEHKAVGGGGD
jgi:hypothetical protein